MQRTALLSIKPSTGTGRPLLNTFDANIHICTSILSITVIMEALAGLDLQTLDIIILSLCGSRKTLLDPESVEFGHLYDAVLKAFAILGGGNRTGKDCYNEWHAMSAPEIASQPETMVVPDERSQTSIPAEDEVQTSAEVDPLGEPLGAIPLSTRSQATTPAPVGPTSTDLERAAAAPPPSNGLKDALVFAVHFLSTAAEIGATVGIWNLVRSRGGADGPGRDKSEWSAALMAGLTFPLVGLLFKKLRKSLAGVIAVNPDVGAMVKGMEWIIGSLLASGELHAGIVTGGAASRAFSDGEKLPEWMFLGYFLTFGLMAVTDVLVARVLRGRITIEQGSDLSSQAVILDELESLIRDLGQIINSPPENAVWYQTLGTSMAALSDFLFSLSRFLSSGVWQIAGYRAYQAYTSRIVPANADDVEYNLKLWSADVVFFLSFRALMWMGARVPETNWSDVWKGLKFVYHCGNAERRHG